MSTAGVILHDKVRKYLIVSSSQHASREKLKMEDILPLEVLRPIRHELEPVMAQLATEKNLMEEKNTTTP